MVWIHGGSFRSGQSLEYQPIRYMEKDIVLVVIQYRLGPIGKLKVFYKKNQMKYIYK